MERDHRVATEHLTDGDLFALALPPTGAPEPLPAHLSECLRCSRALADWKGAVRDLAEEDEEILALRSPEEWRAAEEATLAAVRGSARAGRGRIRVLRWALPAAASLLLFALLVGGRQQSGSTVSAFDDTAGLSAADRADDALLRDVERLASGEEAAWGELAPDPANVGTAPAGEGRS